MSKVENGKNVSVHYVGKFDDGTEFDSSRTRGETLSFEVGSGQLITGFDNAVVGMTVGETKSIKLSPDEGYGPSNPEAVQDVSIDMFPENFEFVVGATVVGQNETGNQMVAKIESVTDESVKLDFNHPMAGKNLNFEIEVMEIS